jgi:phosphopantothenoylcysteine decarboxylase / phosphopantothenate---cysteine ligase
MIPVTTGELASGLFGEGRMAEPEQIVAYLEKEFFNSYNPLQGKKALVSAGPTFEPIDPVRFVGNHSSGKMGVAIAKLLHRKGAEVHLVLGPTDVSFDLEGLKVTRVMSAEEMYVACAKTFPDTDITVMAAAVADYTPEVKSMEKIKKKEDQWSLSFVKTRDILKELGEKKKNDQMLIGFALETQNEKENALAKLKNKNADMIVLNSLNDEGAGFGHETNKITIIYKDGTEKGFPLKSKQSVAEDIVNAIIDKMHA